MQKAGALTSVERSAAARVKSPRAAQDDPDRLAGRRRTPVRSTPLVACHQRADALVMLIPLFFVIGYTSPPLGYAYDLLSSRVGELLFQYRAADRCSVAACAVIGSVPPGSPSGHIPLRWLWNVLLVAPSLSPRSSTASAGSRCSVPGRGVAGAVLIVTLSYFPYVYCRSPRRGGDSIRPTRRRRGRSATAWRTFWLVVLPQLRRRYSAGCCWSPCIPWPSLAPGDAALPDVHHRHLRAVPVHVQRSRR